MNFLTNVLHMGGPYALGVAVMLVLLAPLCLLLLRWERASGVPRLHWALAWLALVLAIAVLGVRDGIYWGLRPTTSHGPPDSNITAVLAIALRAPAYQAWAVGLGCAWLAWLRAHSTGPVPGRSIRTTLFLLVGLLLLVEISTGLGAGRALAVLAAVGFPAFIAGLLMLPGPRARHPVALSACLALAALAGALALLGWAECRPFYALHGWSIVSLETSLQERIPAWIAAGAMVGTAGLVLALRLVGIRPSLPTTRDGWLGLTLGALPVLLLVAGLAEVHRTVGLAMNRLTPVGDWDRLRAHQIPVIRSQRTGSAWIGRNQDLSFRQDGRWVDSTWWRGDVPLSVDELEGSTVRPLLVVDGGWPIATLATVPAPDHWGEAFELRVLGCDTDAFDDGPLPTLERCEQRCVGLAPRADAPDIDVPCESFHAWSQGRYEDDLPFPQLIPWDSPMDIQALFNSCTGPELERPCVLVPPDASGS